MPPTSITADAYDAARRTASRARQVLADAMADHDVILTPSAPGAAPHGFATTGNPMFNRLWTLMGTPCVNVPGLSENGLPLGIQIVGRFGRDRAALEAALFVGTGDCDAANSWTHASTAYSAAARAGRQRIVIEDRRQPFFRLRRSVQPLRLA